MVTALETVISQLSLTGQETLNLCVTAEVFFFFFFAGGSAEDGDSPKYLARVQALNWTCYHLPYIYLTL